MQDAFAYCAGLVRDADRDRYLATLFAPAEHRGALFALYAFNVEVARVREMAHEPLPGEIRLKWWSEVVAGERGGEASANPVADALIRTTERCRLPVSTLADLIEARRFDLYDEPMAGVGDLEDYLRKTSSALIALAARILGVDAARAADPAGVAYGMVRLLRALARHAAQGRLYVPTELSPQVRAAGTVTRRSEEGNIDAAVVRLRTLARDRLGAAREPIAALPPQALPAFLPLALVRPTLDRVERSQTSASADIPPWRRQWLIWRAARNPARITG